MRKLLTLLIMVFLWTSGMAQQAISLGTRKTNDKQVNYSTKTQLPVAVTNADEFMQSAKSDAKAVKKDRTPYCNRSLPEKHAKAVIDNPEPITPHPLAPMQGGETIALAFTLSGALPITSSGTTAGYINDYDESCPYVSNGGRDVVYKYTPAANVTVDIDLCGSAYDTKLYVYENTYTPGAPFACSDDYYTGAPCGQYVSKIIGASLIGGNTYYIVIDGYGASDFGAYSLTISGAIVYPVPPNDLCTGATPVNGPFPQTVTGTTLGATVDCPGVLDWNAVWYAVNLPNAVNDLTVDWCGTEDMSTVGVVYYPTCPVVCGNYVLYTAKYLEYLRCYSGCNHCHHHISGNPRSNNHLLSGLFHSSNGSCDHIYGYRCGLPESNDTDRFRQDCYRCKAWLDSRGHRKLMEC